MHFFVPARSTARCYGVEDVVRFIGFIVRKTKDDAIKQPADYVHEWAGAEKLLQFEQLLSRISATYINLPSSEIEAVIRADLGRLGRFLEVDRCILNLLNEDTKSMEFSIPYHWWREEDDEVMMNFVDQARNDPHFFDSFAYYFDQWSKGKVLYYCNVDDIPKGDERLREAYTRFGVKSLLSVPISAGGRVVGAIVVGTVHSHRAWPEELIPRLRLVGEVFVNSLARKRSDESLRAAHSEIKELKAQLEEDYHYLKEEVGLRHDFTDIVGKSEALQNILAQVRQVAPTDATVLILGETGTGKGLIARAVHNASLRKERPFMQINCAALTPTLIESEFFGHEKGAFTGAQARRIGWFEKAKGTTLFLDEIGELSPEMQSKLLRVLQDGEFERVGGSDTLRTDVRVIAATNRDLEREVKAGRFRQDLWYRLTIFPIYVPPLRVRVDDIPLFVNAFVEKHSKRIGKKFNMIPLKKMQMLRNYSWPGNVRELENLIERAVITSSGGHLKIEGPWERNSRKHEARKTMEEYERDYIIETLEEAYWRIDGELGAASRLGLNPSTLRSRMRKLGIRRPQSRPTPQKP